MRLPHNPGQLSNRSWASSSRPISQDLTRGVIVGQENYTGRAIAFDGSGTVAADSDIEPELGAGVDIVRPNSVEKARSTTLRWITRTLRSSGGGSFTNSQPSGKDIKSCGESESGGGGTGGGGYTFPTPPEDPQEPPEEVVEEVNVAYASSPRACQPKPPTIVRPRQQQDQYYYVDSIDAPCPLGMIKYGYAELPNGDIMIQCKSPAPPPGDGVPSDPTAWGYDCSSCGTCIPVKGGKYPTLEICQQSGCKPVTYQCTPTGCVPVYDGSGNFTTLAACENSCSAVPYACIDGNCVQTLDGKYATLEDCQANCGVSVPYACVDGNCIQTLDGEYATLEDCQANCGVSGSTRIQIEDPEFFDKSYCYELPVTNVVLVAPFYAVPGEQLYFAPPNGVCTSFAFGQTRPVVQPNVEGTYFLFDTDQGQIKLNAFFFANPIWHIYTITITPL
jgi:hypothetical protein